jgi:hypothetical protein
MVMMKVMMVMVVVMIAVMVMQVRHAHKGGLRATRRRERNPRTRQQRSDPNPHGQVSSVFWLTGPTTARVDRRSAYARISLPAKDVWLDSLGNVNAQTNSPAEGRAVPGSSTVVRRAASCPSSSKLSVEQQAVRPSQP